MEPNGFLIGGFLEATRGWKLVKGLSLERIHGILN
jgi:hypothetical protein